MPRVRPGRYAAVEGQGGVPMTRESEPTADISVERVRPGQPEFEPRHVRSHEVRSYGKTSWVEWLFLISGFGLCAAWLLLLAAVMYAVTVG